MKGLVLAGGKGTRLRPLTYTGAKQLVPLANKPVLFYVLEDLAAASVVDVGVVVGDTGDQIRAAIGDGSAFGCRVTYIQQEFAGGLAHAVRSARGFLADDPFVMYLGDNFIQGGISRYVEAFDQTRDSAHVLLYHVPNPEDFGVAEIHDGRIVRLEEKPREPKSDLALVGIYFFRAEIHAATAAIEPSWRGELEITDAITKLLEDGHSVRPHILDGWWIDTGKMEDMLDANRLVLQGMRRRVDGSVLPDCVLQGDVIIEHGAQISSSTLRGPLIIGTGARIENAYVGPFTAIGARCHIKDCEIENSIVMEGSCIVDVPHRLEGSLIGRDVTVSRSPLKPKAYKLMLGDHSRVGIV